MCAGLLTNGIDLAACTKVPRMNIAAAGTPSRAIKEEPWEALHSIRASWRLRFWSY